MSFKYYHVENAGRMVVAKPFSIPFRAYEFLSGRWMGFYRTDDAQQQEALDAVVKDPKSGVTALTVAEYRLCQQKKMALGSSSGIWNAPQPPESTMGILEDASRAGVPVNPELPTPLTAPGAVPASSTDQALTVGDTTSGAGSGLPGQGVLPGPGNAATPPADAHVGADLS